VRTEDLIKEMAYEGDHDKMKRECERKGRRIR
jgi:hypothetical protein